MGSIPQMSNDYIIFPTMHSMGEKWGKHIITLGFVLPELFCWGKLKTAKYIHIKNGFFFYFKYNILEAARTYAQPAMD